MLGSEYFQEFYDPGSKLNTTLYHEGEKNTLIRTRFIFSFVLENDWSGRRKCLKILTRVSGSVGK